MLKHHQFVLFAILLLSLIERNGSLGGQKTRTGPDKPNFISDERTRRSINGVTDKEEVFHQALDNILVPRVVGTSNHSNVIKYITDEMRNLNWSVEHDTFTAETPMGKKTFTNIIATPDPKAPRYLDIACHFDSKFYENIVFYGATDSAVPCAMMLHLAHALNPLLEGKKNDTLSLRYIFFDGEEAFVSWTDSDSLYGSRHLAEKWEKTMRNPRSSATELDKMELLVLLDLLGASNPKFYSFFSDTQHWYKMLVNAQTELQNLGLIPKDARYFEKMSTYHRISDDHLPFQQRGVPILHIIPIPFPSEWHTASDDYDCIDFAVVRDLTKILALFISDSLSLR